MAEVELGKVTHYFSKIGVAAIEIQRDMLAVGDTIHVKGHTSDFTQNVDSMQVDHQLVTVAKAGQSVGIHVAGHAHEHDKVYKVVAVIARLLLVEQHAEHFQGLHGAGPGCAGPGGRGSSPRPSAHSADIARATRPRTARPDRPGRPAKGPADAPGRPPGR